MDSCADKIIKEISTLDREDDGIALNQKCKHVLGVLESLCTTAEHLREIYNCLNEQSMKDSRFAQKFALLSASRLFQKIELFGQKATCMIMAIMKENYDKLDNLIESNLDGFYNYITLFGEYFSRAKMSDGSSLSYLVIPLIECLTAMIHLNTERSAQEFATQMLLNGPVMYKTHHSKMYDLMIAVRKSIFAPHRENERVQMWLLLCVDLSLKQFRELDPKLGKFYTDILQQSKSGRDLKKLNKIEKLNESQKAIQADDTEKEYCNALNNMQQSQIVQQEFQKIIQVDVTEKEGNNSNKEKNLTNVQHSQPSTNTSYNIPRYDTRSRYDKYSGAFVKRDQHNIRDKNDDYSGGCTKRDNFSGGYEKRDSSHSRSGNWSKNENYSARHMKCDTPPPRFDVNHQHGTPRVIPCQQRIQRVFSPHQASYEKAQRLKQIIHK